MNVDASVVIIDSIARHFVRRRQGEAPDVTMVAAIKEVLAPLLSSTAASLMVFVPLVYTSKMTHALLGDLARTVIFSHACSLLIAVVLVPTVRLHIFANGRGRRAHAGFLSRALARLTMVYTKTLRSLSVRPGRTVAAICVVTLGGIASAVWALGGMEQSMIDRPETDWIVIRLNSRSNTRMTQMAANASAIEREVIAIHGGRVLYTFSQVTSPDSAHIMMRLKSKDLREEVSQQLVEQVRSTTDLSVDVSTWNPSEIPLPTYPDALVTVRGTSVSEIGAVARRVQKELDALDIFQTVWTEPWAGLGSAIEIRPNPIERARVKKIRMHDFRHPSQFQSSLVVEKIPDYVAPIGRPRKQG